MKKTDLGNGSWYSERQTAMRPTPSNVCLGTGDFLPRRAVTGDMTLTFSYAPIQQLPNPRD